MQFSKIRLLFILAIFIQLPFWGQAQHSAVGIHLGLSNYLGDIVPYDLTISNAQFSYGLFYRFQPTPKIALRANAMIGRLKDSDSEYVERRNRNFSFETSYTQLTLLAEYHLNGKARYDEDGVFQRNTTYYILAGIGGIFFDPETGGLPPLSPERNTDFSTAALTIPVGVGIQLPLSEEISLGAEIGAHFTFTDYLDGISESANPDQNDAMGHFEINVAYHFGVGNPDK